MGLSVNVEKQLGSFCLTSSLEAPDGTTALLGASGCGKTMTLKCIAGILKPDRGRIVLNGRVLFDKEKGINLPPQERKVGYLFQNYALFPNMTVEKNLLCAAPGNRREKADLLAKTLRRFRLEGDSSSGWPWPGSSWAARRPFCWMNPCPPWTAA